VAVNGTQLTHRKFDGDLGTLDLRSKLDTKGKLLSAMVQSVDGKHFFELVYAPLRVPAGEYRILSGCSDPRAHRKEGDA
jgi:hypothetical protein